MNPGIRKSERGFTSIELLVASMLSILVLTLAGGMMISSLTAEQTVKDTTDSSNLGQLAAKAIAHGVRHANALSLTAPTADTQVLMAHIVDDAVAEPAVAHCEAWYYGEGEVRWRSSPSAIAAPATAADASDWVLLAEGVSPVNSTPVFTLSGTTVDVVMQLSGTHNVPILITTTAVSRQPAPTEVATLCF